MKDLEKLSAMLQEIDDLLSHCMKCGLCQAVCPVFKETQLESDVTRGKLYMLEGLARHMISDAKGVKERLDKCLLCGTCVSSCPSGVSALEIFVLARAILTEFLGLSPMKKAIFRGLVAHPSLFNNILDLSKRFQGVFIKPANPKMGTYCSAALSSFIGNRHFMPLAKTPLHARRRKPSNAKEASRIKVVLFPGCVVDKIYPHVGETALEVLEQYQVQTVVPEMQACCGIPALASGDTKSFERLFHQNMDLFVRAEADYLLTPCATCTSTIKKIWPMMVKDLNLGRNEEVERLANTTMDISEFMVDVLRVSPPALSPGGKVTRVTYHDPCHLGKSLGVVSQPRDLLKSNRNIELVEMAEANVCCGNGGSFNLQHYQTSTAIGKRKCDHVIATGAEIVATSCPACMMQLTDLLSQKQQAIAVKHVIEVFAENASSISPGVD